MKLRQHLYSTPDKNETKPAQIAALSFILGSVALAIAGTTLILWNHSRTHLPFRTTLSGVAVGGKTPAQATNLVKEHLGEPSAHDLTLIYQEGALATSSAELGAQFSVSQAVKEALGQSEQLSIQTLFYDIKHFFEPYQGEVLITYNPEVLDQMLSLFESQITDQPQEPEATLVGKQEISIFPGKKGTVLDHDATKRQISTAVNKGNYTVPVVTRITGTELTAEEQAAFSTLAKKLLGSSLSYSAEGYSGSLSAKQLIPMLMPDGSARRSKTDTLVAEWQKKLEREPHNPVFEYDKETLKVLKFEPPRTGRTVDLAASTQLLNQKISSLLDDATVKTAEISIPLTEKEPEISLASTNDLGIIERIGRGDSQYDHSIPNRIHNVAITAERINNILVAPGEEFSFNKTLGDVSAKTGYRSAYVIRNGRTELGDGGGVCQVSTTLFRSVLDAGLPVTLRLPHSYRVSYYELDRKPGVDATVYSGNVDFRFKNDTGKYLLIHGAADSTDLYMYLEIYGTSDGRTSQIVDHKTWNARGAPPAQYIDTTELPPGKIQQIDWAAPGISSSFTQVVKNKEGEVISEKTYTSHYKPWAAKYLRGV